jgi:hypothetical protein
MGIEQVVNAVDIAIHKLPYIESLYEQVKDQIDKMQHTRQRLVNDIRALERKISILDKTAFSCEQECKKGTINTRIDCMQTNMRNQFYYRNILTHTFSINDRILFKTLLSDASS